MRTLVDLEPRCPCVSSHWPTVGSTVSRPPPAVGSFRVCPADKTTLLEGLHLTLVTGWGEGIKAWPFWPKLGMPTATFPSRAPSYRGPQICWAHIAVRVLSLPNSASVPFFSEVLIPNKHIIPKFSFRFCFWRTPYVAASFYLVIFCLSCLSFPHFLNRWRERIASKLTSNWH